MLLFTLRKAARRNPFRIGVSAALLHWDLCVAGVVIVATMSVLILCGYVYLKVLSYCFHAEVERTGHHLDVLFQLPEGAPIPKTIGRHMSPLLLNLQYLQPVGPDVRNDCRWVLSELTEAEWVCRGVKVHSMCVEMT